MRQLTIAVIIRLRCKHDRIARRSFNRRRKGELDRLAKHSASKPRGFGTVSKALLAIAIPITIGASISPLTGMVDSALIGRILTKLGYSEGG